MLNTITKSEKRASLPIGIYKGYWSGFTVTVRHKTDCVCSALGPECDNGCYRAKPISFEVQDFSPGLLPCTVMVKANNVAYVSRHSELK